MSVVAMAKRVARQRLPSRLEVPLRYYYGVVSGKMEPEVGLLRHLIKPGDRMIDVGANRGLYTYKSWRLGARVEAFEPNPVCLRVLTSWLEGKAEIALHPVGLSDRQGVAELNVPVDESGVEHDASASLGQPKAASIRIQPIELRTLDSFRFFDCSFIKIDVEGHERAVIEGAKETLLAAKPALLIEIEQRHGDQPIASTFDRLKELGYNAFFFRDGKLVDIVNFDVERDQSQLTFENNQSDYVNNFLFVAAEKQNGGSYSALPFA